MNSRFLSLVLGILSLFFLVGCGSGSDGGTDLFGRPPVVEDTSVRRVTVNHIIAARQVSGNIVGFSFRGMSGDNIVFGPTQRGLQGQVILSMPVTATELRIAYLDVNGNIVGVFQQALPDGRSEVTVNDPAFVDLTEFVASISFTNPSLSLEVDEQTQTAVTATLVDNSVVDVSTVATITSAQTAVATVNNGIIIGVAEGQATLNASLFGRTSSQAVTVTPATL